MKKFMHWMLAAILICGATTFTSCTNEDNPVDPTANLSEKIIGKWMTADIDGKSAPTNEKTVLTFLSATKATVSESKADYAGQAAKWSPAREYEVQIDGDKVTLTGHPTEINTIINEYTIISINDNEMSCALKHTVIRNDKIIKVTEMKLRFTKLITDNAEPILGLWECEGLIGDETYNDGNDRLEFLSDGTYRYYRQDDNGQWQAVTTREFQDYFVDGTLLATRWKNKGEDELREWWEIESLSGDQMVWTALRQKEDGSTFQQKMTWKKIDLKVAEKIIGKWMPAELDGKPVQTDKKSVYTFVSATKAYMSVSTNPQQGEETVWNDQKELDVAISGNTMTLTNHSDEHTTMVEEFCFTAISGSEFTANHKITVTNDGATVLSNEGVIHFAKVTADYSEAILGTWEGKVTSSEGSEFDDGETHRWEYKADGTYVYYSQNEEGEWVPSGDEISEYFVDGTLLCTRWGNNEQENREWWEITINGNKMNWTALRQNEDRTTFTATFEMTKVE